MLITVSHFNHFDGCVGISHCGLLCISLMTNDVNYLFMCLFATYIFSLVKYLHVFAHFLVVLFVFIKLSFESSLYVPDTRPLSYMCFANTFSQSVICLFILLTVTFAEQMFLKFLLRSNLYNFPLVGHSFGVKCKNSLSAHMSPENFLLFLSWRFYSFLFTLNP